MAEKCRRSLRPARAANPDARRAVRIIAYSRPGGECEKPAAVFALRELSGEYKDGATRYEGEIHTPRGKTLTRVTFFNLSPGRVRHTQDDSNDGGKTWANVWDSVYVRKRPAPR